MDYAKVETTISAINTGNLDPNGWELNHIIALGFSGRRNPLGSALLHWIERESEHNAFLARFHLANELTRQKVCQPKESVDYAHEAMSWYRDQRCPDCRGRGNVPDVENPLLSIQCHKCGGTGDKGHPSNQTLRDAVSVLVDALNYLENQLHARLRGSPVKPVKSEYKLSDYVVDKVGDE